MPFRDPEEQRRYQREWKARRRADWLAANGPCVDCGSWDSLEIDHLDPSTKVSHRVFSWSRERREAELEKCVIRCKSCHAHKTAAECVIGEANGQARLNEAAVAIIRASSDSTGALARRFGVARNTIWLARTYQTWNDRKTVWP